MIVSSESPLKYRLCIIFQKIGEVSIIFWQLLTSSYDSHGRFQGGLEPRGNPPKASVEKSLNAGTSVFGNLASFSVLGHLPSRSNVSESDLDLVVFPNGSVSCRLRRSGDWRHLIFLALFRITVDSEIRASEIISVFALTSSRMFHYLSPYRLIFEMKILIQCIRDVQQCILQIAARLTSNSECSRRCWRILGLIPESASQAQCFLCRFTGYCSFFFVVRFIFTILVCNYYSSFMWCLFSVAK